MEKLLLISKSGEFIDDYAAHLTQRGIIVRLTLTIQDAVDMIAVDDYGVIIADNSVIKNMRHINDLRKSTYAPIIIYSMEYNFDSMARSLQAGADEYHINNDGIEDIYSTIKAVIRRYREYNDSKKHSSNIVKLGEIAIHLNTRRAYINGNDLGISKRELDIILLFLDNKDKTLTYDSIFSSIWGGSFHKKHIKAIRSQMHRLSAKIDVPTSSIKYILNIRECGYQLNPALFVEKQVIHSVGSDVHKLLDILLIGYYGDDSEELEQLLSIQDNKQYHRAEAVNNILQALTNYVFALIIINGENLSCLEFVRLVREATLSPILVTTNKYDIRIKAAVIDSGADGYLLIKYNEDIYEAVNVLIRRSSVYNNKANSTMSKISVGDLVVDLDNRKAFVLGRKIELTKKEFDILTLILEQKGEIVTYEQICDQAWGEKYTHDSYKPVMRLVHKLREKIKVNASSSDYILNIREVGYRLNTEIDL